MKFHYALLAGLLAAISAFVAKLISIPVPSWFDQNMFLKLTYYAIVLAALIVIEIFKMKAFLTALSLIKSWQCTLLAFFANITFSVS